VPNVLRELAAAAASEPATYSLVMTDTVLGLASRGRMARATPIGGETVGAFGAD